MLITHMDQIGGCKAVGKVEKTYGRENGRAPSLSEEGSGWELSPSEGNP